MLCRTFLSLSLIAISISSLFGQSRVDDRNMYERIMCVVPMVGKGTWDDPRRPLFAPTEGTKRSGSAGIIGYSYQVSDDGQSALVEFVGHSRADFKEILADTTHNLKIFIKGKNSRAEVEQEFKKYKQDFDLEKFAGATKGEVAQGGATQK